MIVKALQSDLSALSIGGFGSGFEDQTQRSKERVLLQPQSRAA